jgi:hypothetical protein
MRDVEGPGGGCPDRGILVWSVGAAISLTPSFRLKICRCRSATSIANNMPLHPDNRRHDAHVHDRLYPGVSKLMLSPFLVQQQVNLAAANSRDLPAIRHRASSDRK